MAIAAPAAAAVGRAAAGKVAQKTAGKGAQKAAGKAAGGKGAAAAGAAPTGGKKPPAGGKKGGGPPDVDMPERPWKDRGEKKGKGRVGKALSAPGSQGTYRRALIAEFIVCMLLLGLSPLAKGPGEMGPVRFMKRGTATAAFFVILGLVSSAGAGAAKAAAMFGGLVTLVLLVDQREAFGKMAQLLNAPDEGDEVDPVAGVGPDESTDAGPDVVAT